MKSLFHNLLLAVALIAPVTALADSSGRLFIIGSATPSGWDLDMAQCLMPEPGNGAIHSATIYLKGGEGNTFKFMEEHEWGSTEYGLPAPAAVSGAITLATGTLDNGYSQLYVAQDGNYHISVDTATLTGTVVRSDYQAEEIKYCTLFLIGDATEGGWTVENGSPLYQSVAEPFVYSATVPLKASGSFKIGNALRGAGTWNPQFYYFRNPDDAGSISTDSTDDRQWSVSKDGDYKVTVNTVANTISIVEQTGSSSGIEDILHYPGAAEPVYYDLQGRRVDNPSNGVYLQVSGNTVTKIMRH